MTPSIRINDLLIEVRARQSSAASRMRSQTQSQDLEDDALIQEVQDLINNGLPSEIAAYTVNSYKGACQWVTALVDYYTSLVAANGPNPMFQHPRGPLVSALLKVYKKALTYIKRHGLLGSAMADRGRNTLGDGADELDIYEGCKLMWTIDSNESSTLRKSKKIEKDLRTRAETLLSFGLMCRSDTPRKLKLSDIGLLNLPDEGPNGAKVLRVSYNESKTNQFGNIENNGALRHNDVTCCPVGSIAFYLFYRFNINGEVWPAFKNRSSWYEINLFKGQKQQ